MIKKNGNKKKIVMVASIFFAVLFIGTSISAGVSQRAAIVRDPIYKEPSDGTDSVSGQSSEPVPPNGGGVPPIDETGELTKKADEEIPLVGDDSTGSVDGQSSEPVPPNGGGVPPVGDDSTGSVDGQSSEPVSPVDNSETGELTKKVDIIYPPEKLESFENGLLSMILKLFLKL